MSIELAASQRALNEARPLNVDEAGLEPDHFTTAFVGVELGALGAAPDDAAVTHDLPADQVDIARLVSSIHAAHEGGIDFISLDSTFTLRSDSAPHESMLDAARAAARIASSSTGGVFVQVPPAPKVINMAIDLIAAQENGWAGIAFGLNDHSDFDSIVACAHSARRAGIKVAVIITHAEQVQERADVIAEIADMVRLQCPDPHTAREARFALRSAAAKRGRELLVFVELGMVISGSLNAALERESLIKEIHRGDIFAGIAKCVGTVYDAADAVESWVANGAADGIVIIPASLPCDLASILKGVLPLISARSAAK